MSDGARARAWRIGGNLAAAAFGVLVLWLLFRSLSGDIRALQWRDIMAHRPALLPLVASFIVLVGAQLLNAFLWRRIAVDIGSPRPNVRATLHIYFVSSLARYVPGKVVQIAGLAVLADRFGMAAGRAAAASVISQLAFIATGLLFLGFALPDLAGALGSTSPLVRIDPIISAGIVIISTAAGVWMLAATPVGDAVRSMLVRAAGEKLGGRLGNAVAVAEDIRPGNAALWLLGFLGSWIVVGGAFVLFAGAFDPAALQAPLLVGGVIAGAYIAGFLVPFLPAGAGVREVVIIALLSGIVPPGVAVLIAFSSRLWFTFAELLPLLFIPLAPGPAQSRPITAAGTTSRQGTTLPGII